MGGNSGGEGVIVDEGIYVSLEQDVLSVWVRGIRGNLKDLRIWIWSWWVLKRCLWRFDGNFYGVDEYKYVFIRLLMGGKVVRNELAMNRLGLGFNTYIILVYVKVVYLWVRSGHLGVNNDSNKMSNLVQIIASLLFN